MRRTPSHLFACLFSAFCAFSGFGARHALAEGGGKNPAAAQALYDEARRLVDVGKFAEACPKFKASYELDPGGGTLLNLADCYEKQGKTALAWSTFKEALVAARRDGRNERIEFANQHIAELEGRLSRLTVNLSDDARVPGVSVSVDGAPLGQAAWGVAMPVDPGKHVVRAEAPGKHPFESTFEVTAGGATQQTILVPGFADAATSQKPLVHTNGKSSGTTPLDSDAFEASSSQKTLGWIVGGVGVASVGVGSYFGLRAMSRWDDREQACVGGCTDKAKQAGDESNDAATVSTIGFGVGLVAVGIGTFLIISSPRRRSSLSAARGVRVMPSVGQDRAGLLLRSAW